MAPELQILADAGEALTEERFRRRQVFMAQISDAIRFAEGMIRLETSLELTGRRLTR